VPPDVRTTTLARRLGRLAGRALDVAWPAECVSCGTEGEALCDRCRPGLEVRLSAPPGTPLGLPADIPMTLLQLEWCAPFSGAARRAVHGLKYAGDRRLARPLGEAIARRWAAATAGGDMLVPVPASPDRVRRRGYDQARLLAEAAGRALDLPVVPALVRRRSTAAQFDLDRSARTGNVRGAFVVTPESAGGALRGRWLVLVDDVVTTGATLAASAEALLAAGAMGVSAVTLARER
jgi:ComF family protein